MSEKNRLLNFPTTETYADQLEAAKARVERALVLLRNERLTLEQLLLLPSTNTPQGRTH